jgi:hypothetical protein
LDEEFALQVARDTLRQEGLDPSEWRPVESVGKWKGPNGKCDKFFARNLDPNRGYVQFVTEDHQTRFVSVELETTRITGRVSRGK